MSECVASSGFQSRYQKNTDRSRESQAVNGWKQKQFLGRTGPKRAGSVKGLVRAGSRVHAGVGLFLIRAAGVETRHPGPVGGPSRQVGEAREQGQGGEHREGHTYGGHRSQGTIGTQITEQQAQQPGDHGAPGGEDRLQDTTKRGPGGFRPRLVAPQLLPFRQPLVGQERYGEGEHARQQHHQWKEHRAVHDHQDHQR